MRFGFKSVLVAHLLALVAVGLIHADDTRRVMVPDDVFYYQPAASVFGAEAAWVNPAALARFNTPSLQIMADYHDGAYGESWGVVGCQDRSALAYREIDNPSGANFKEWLGAAGLAWPNMLHVGISYRYFKDGPDIYRKRHLWNIGLLGFTRGPVSWAAVFSNLNRGRIGDERSETEQRYSLAYRPLGPRLTLAADMFLSTRTRLSNAHYIYHGEFIPLPGLLVGASIDSDRNFQVGVRANLLKYFVGQKSHFDKNGHGGRTTAYIGLTDHRQASLIPEPRRRLSLGISGRPAENPPRPVFGRKATPFVNIIAAVYRAAEDNSIGEMVLTLRSLSLGFGQAQELREAIAHFRSKNKRVVCHIEFPNNISYYVASIADRVLMPPVGQLRLVGLRAELTFYAGTLDKLGVNADLLRVGQYKTAVERYVRSESSEEYRSQINRLLDNLYEQFIEAIAQGRGLSADSVRTVIDNGPFTSVEALEFGLVDGLVYKDELVDDYLRPEPEISFRRYWADTLLNDDWQPRPVLAVVVADGEITSSGQNLQPWQVNDNVTPSLMGRALGRAGRNPDVKGVVFRVNSPGGWALAAEEIYRQAWLLSQEKPLVVSMGNIAASGAYYISMPGKRLFANQATITGSIGIYGGKVDLAGLYDKIGVGKELYTRGKYAGMLTSMRPFSEDERAKYGSHLRAFYDHFVNLVADNRQMTPDSVDILGRGQVWTGLEAQAIGLVDELGGLKQSMEYMAGDLALNDYRIVVYPRKRPLFILPGRSLIDALTGFLGLGSSARSLRENESALADNEYLLARMPYDIEVE